MPPTRRSTEPDEAGPLQPPAGSEPAHEYLSFLDSVPVPLFFKWRDGRYAWFNRAFRDEYVAVFGVAADSLQGLMCADTADSAEIASAADVAEAQVLATGETVSYSIPHVFPDGRVHRLLLRKSPYCPPGSDEAQGVMTVILDVTDAAEAQAALAASERNYRELVEKANALIMAMDCEGRLTFANDYAVRFFGFEPDEAIGKLALGTLIPLVEADGRDLQALITDILAAPERHVHVENENLTRDGRRVWIAWTNTVVHDENGRVVGIQAIGQDITQRRLMEERLRISEAAIESAIDAIGIADLSGNIIYVNQAYLDFWGLGSRDEALGRPIQDFMISTDADDIIAAIRSGGWVGERESRSRDGSRFFLRVSANIVRGEDGRPLCMMAALQDITQRKLAEEDLRTFKNIADKASYGSVIIGDDLIIRYCNETFAAMHGYTIDEMVGQPLSLLHTEEQWQEVLRLGQRLRDTGQLVAEPIWRKRRDGSVFPSLLSVSYMEGQLSETIRAATVVDISALQQAMAELAAEKERLAVTLSSIGDGVIATDTDGRITLMNPVAEVLTGWPEADALGGGISDICACTGACHAPCLEVIHEALTSRQAAELPPDVVLVGRDGVRRTVAGVAAPIMDAADELVGAVLAFRDVTEQERMRQEVHQAHKLESLGILAGGIAHDFNNLLTSILGGINLARTEARLPAAIREGLQTATKAALMARHLSQQLLTFSRGGAPVRRSVDLAEIIQGSVDLTISGSPTAAAIQLSPSLWPVEADAGQLSQALNNIMLNAVQAMPQGGTLRIEAANVTIGGQHDTGLSPGRYVRVQISDDGPGITPEVLSRIFDPYFTTKDTGSGLGLTIAYSILNKHEGHIAIASQPGQGASVRLHIPASLRPPVEALPDIGEPATGEGRVLVMDDDPYVRKVVGPMLAHLGYEADVVADAEGAVARLTSALRQGLTYRAAILDLTIKGGPGGVQALEHLRELEPQLQALACSGYHNDPVMANYTDYGFNGIITKPYQVHELSVALSGLDRTVNRGPD